MRDINSRVRYRTIVWCLRVGLGLAFVAVWQLSATKSVLISQSVSAPLEVISVLGEWLVGPQHRWDDILSTLAAAAVGLVIGVLLGIVLTGILASHSDVAKVLTPYVASANAVPKVVLAPLFVLWFGLGFTSKLAFVTAVISFIVFYNLFLGLRNQDQDLVRNVRALGSRRRDMFREVTVPSLTGWLIASLRVCVAFSLLGAVVAEFLGSSSGIGAVINRGQLVLAADEVIAGTVLIGSLAVILDRLLIRVESHLQRWRTA